MTFRPIAVLLACCAVLPLSAAEPVKSSADDVKFVKLTVFPERLDLSNGRDARRLIVAGLTDDGRSFDVTARAKFEPKSNAITIDKDGYVVPSKATESAVLVSLGGLTAEVPVAVKDAAAPAVQFIRDIEPVMAKVGCNAGTCHGSQQGKAGFKLSLRGYDPLFDYTALVDDVSGRRFNRAVPEQSLMLLKPTSGVPHEGGFLFDEDSRYYALIRDWIAEGCRYETAERPTKIEVFPPRPLLNGVDDVQQLIVVASYPDGMTRDVTREAVYETSNLEVTAVSSTGQIKALRKGEAAALVRFEGNYASAPVSVLGETEGFEWLPTPEYGEIDRLVHAKLQRSKILPSELCSDAEFLRRVSIDLTGLPPTPEQVQAFVSDPQESRAKREAKIDELLASPGYVDYWTLKWGDLLMANRKDLQERGVWAFRNWIRESVATNQPYDEFVSELLTASGNSIENPAANYYRIGREPETVMENMTQVFLGTRFNCNKCHDHPFERWTQRQYYELAGYLSGVGFAKADRPDAEYVFALDKPKPVVFPQTNQPVDAKFPFELAGMSPTDEDLRVSLAEWLTAHDNPYFARSLVNRYWSYFLGKGIIDPVDDIRASNPATNPELLAWLEQDFVASGFDLKHLIRTITTSATYQRSYRTNASNETDDVLFSHSLPRRLTAEQLYDSILIAAGAPSNLPGLPPGFRATQSPDPGLNVEFLDLFGRAPRESPCECERSSEVSLAQTLNLVNGETIAAAVSHPEGRIAKLLASKASAEEIARGIYLAVLCREPTDDELEKSARYVTETGDTKIAAEDLMWALINSPAFLFNR
ncbi:MAG: DUF1549 and DUF1553 domain-containing protein [Planctomycetota bacterium]|nr:DUF1553 domain-containing protein [Planctomycetaceae bacterium]MDQ3329399.1 DUF1549 and DUF1553 domain-containing protein [Planctomycetota bacterium]